MKKIALLLALALALSCCLLMLAACGEEETPADESSSASPSSEPSTPSAAESSEEETTSEPDETSEPEETSEPDETSEPETSEPETSEPETSEPTDEPNPDATPNPDGKNLAAGKSYTISQLFRQAQLEDGSWGWVETATPSYDDEGGVTLTDGLFPDADTDYQDLAWMGFHGKCPDYIENGYSYFTVDLGDVYALSKLVTYVGTSKLDAGVSVPATVEFYVSEDGENFTSVGSFVPVDDPDHNVLAITLDCNVTAQFVQVRMTAANWMFVCEFEAF